MVLSMDTTMTTTTTTTTTTAKTPSSPNGILKVDGPSGRTAKGLPVTFSEEPQYHTIPSIFDLSEFERQDLWFARFEYDLIKANNKILAKMIKAGGFKEDDRYCFRGLEYKTKEGMTLRKRVKDRAQQAVFDEQARHWEQGKAIDAKRLRDVYKSIADASAARARTLGRQDAKVASLGEVNKQGILGWKQNWFVSGTDDSAMKMPSCHANDGPSKPLRSLLRRSLTNRRKSKEGETPCTD